MNQYIKQMNDQEKARANENDESYIATTNRGDPNESVNTKNINNQSKGYFSEVDYDSKSQVSGFKASPVRRGS